MEIQESGEMYLETILLLSKSKPNVRAVDIVEHLNYSKSSVSRAVNLLKNNGFINIATDGIITFTTEGLEHAQIVLERHKIITEFLIELGVAKEVAETDACRMEHVISRESVNAIKMFLKIKK